MGKETRVYVINIDELDTDELNKRTTDSEWMDISERQGKVYTLIEFQKAFNDSTVNTATDMIRIIDVDVQ